MTGTAEPLTFELCVRKNPTASKHLPDTPAGFTKITGSWPTVSAEANRRNALTAAYFYFPEATPVDWDRTHCDMCKRMAIHQALEDD
jgi:hypothetical protein